MSRRNTFRRLNVESLEDRRVATINVGGGIGTVPIGPVQPPEFDGVLSASLEVNGSGKHFVFVNGSDNRDVVRILNFTGNAVTVQLQMFVGTQLVTNETRTFNSTIFNPGALVVVDAKGGNDEVRNETAAIVNVNGGAGEDALYAGSGGGALQGGPGNDTIIGREAADHLSGDGGNDYIRGGAGKDLIFGGAENDLLFGEQGNDELLGDVGDDTIWGMEGADVISGGIGNDTLYGDFLGISAGNDTMFGNGGDDVMFGDGGDDTLNGDSGSSSIGDKDTLYGGMGNDNISGNGGNDKLYGDQGHDRMFGNEGADRVYGGDGNDYLNGGIDDPDGFCDFLQGDLGADTFVRHHFVNPFAGDYDIFNAFNSAEGDSVDDLWHW